MGPPERPFRGGSNGDPRRPDPVTRRILRPGPRRVTREAGHFAPPMRGSSSCRGGPREGRAGAPGRWPGPSESGACAPRGRQPRPARSRHGPGLSRVGSRPIRDAGRGAWTAPRRLRAQVDARAADLVLGRRGVPAGVRPESRQRRRVRLHDPGLRAARAGARRDRADLLQEEAARERRDRARRDARDGAGGRDARRRRAVRRLRAGDPHAPRSAGDRLRCAAAPAAGLGPTRASRGWPRASPRASRARARASTGHTRNLSRSGALVAVSGADRRSASACASRSSIRPAAKRCRWRRASRARSRRPARSRRSASSSRRRRSAAKKSSASSRTCRRPSTRAGSAASPARSRGSARRICSRCSGPPRRSAR